MRSLPTSAFFLIYVASACALERRPLTSEADLDGGTTLDVGPGPDVADLADAGGETDTGPLGCVPACVDGNVCVGDTCVCPAGACCPACVASEECVGGSCEPCGADGQPCCMDACVASAICSAGRCEACGADGQPCCAADTCTAPATCSGGRCSVLPPPCGGVGQICCPSDRCNAATEVCVRAILAPPTCTTCGVTGGPCCPGGPPCVSPGDLCSIGTCSTCGEILGPCCPPPGMACTSGPCRAGFCTGL